MVIGSLFISGFSSDYFNTSGIECCWEVSQGQCVLTLYLVRFSVSPWMPKIFSFYRFNKSIRINIWFNKSINKCIWNFSRTKYPISYCRLVLYFRKYIFSKYIRSYYISKFLCFFYFWLICYALCSGETNNASARSILLFLYDFASHW